LSENVSIKELLGLKEKFFVGQTNIAVEGTLKKVLQAAERKGTGGRPDFWSQFLVVEDGTGSIGVDLTAGKAEDTIPESAKGSRVRIENGKGAVYPDKSGKTQRKLTKGKVTLLGPAGAPKLQPDNGEPKLLRTYKLALAQALIRAGSQWSKETEKEAEAWVGWIYQPLESKGALPEGPKEKGDQKEKRLAPEKKTGGDLLKAADEEFDRGKEEASLGRLYVEAYQAKLFNQDYELSQWLEENFHKKSLTALTDDELITAVCLLQDMLKKTRIPDDL